MDCLGITLRCYLKKKKSPWKRTWSAKSSKKELQRARNCRVFGKFESIGSLKSSVLTNVVLPPHKPEEKEWLINPDNLVLYTVSLIKSLHRLIMCKKPCHQLLCVLGKIGCELCHSWMVSRVFYDRPLANLELLSWKGYWITFLSIFYIKCRQISPQTALKERGSWRVETMTITWPLHYYLKSL